MSSRKAVSGNCRHFSVSMRRAYAGAAHLALIASLLCVVAVGFLVAEWWLWAPQPPVPSDSARREATEQQGVQSPAADDFRLRSLDTFSGVWERPLFVQGRRPPPPAPPEPEAPPPPLVPEAPPPPKEPLKMEISAILAIGQERSIMLRNPPKDSPSRLKLGSEHQGWRVERIEDDRVVMSRGDEREEVVLRKFEAAPPGPEVAGGAPPSGVPGAAQPPVQDLKQQIDQAKRQNERQPRQKPGQQAPTPAKPLGMGGPQGGAPSLPAERAPRQPKADGARKDRAKGSLPPGI